MSLIPAYWYATSNFGDNLTPWIIRKLGHTPILVSKDSEKRRYVITGSILSEANDRSSVWGAGIGNKDEVVNSGALILAVRGPISRHRAISCGASCPDVCGDPALLMPLLYEVTKADDRRYKVGLLPHFIDQEHVLNERLLSSDNVLIIDALGTPESVADAVSRCDFVVSSSLHGIIVSMAYGIRCVWAKFTNLICGDGVKFIDFMMSVGLSSDVRPVSFVGKQVTEEDLLVTEPFAMICNYNTDRLVEACPFWK